MTMPLDERLRRIEARLDALETREAGSGLPLPGVPRLPPVAPETSRPVPPPLPRRPAAPSPKPRRPVDWERFFGLAVLGRVGVAAVLLAATYFAKLAYDALEDVVKVGAIYGLSGAFLATGWFFRDRVARRYVALLWGGAAAAAYLAGLAAHLRYGLVSVPGGLAMLFAASVLGQALARRLREPALATIALAGAFAAPLLVAFPLAERGFPLDPTFLLVYVLTLHFWSAWMERAWGWPTARVVGVLGTATVVGVWLFQAGAVDASTYLHLHAYLLGLALPELLAAATGRALPRWRQVALPGGLALAECALVLTAGGLLHLFALPAFTALAGAGWLAVALALSTTRARDDASPLVRGFGRLGGVMLALGLLHLSDAVMGGGTNAEAAWTVAGLTGLSFFLLLLRRRLGVGDLGAAFAAPFAAIVALRQPPVRSALELAPVALAASVALVVWGRGKASRGVAFWVGTGLLFLAFLRAQTWHEGLTALAFVAAALWVVAATTWGRRRGQADLERQDLPALSLLALLWVPFAFSGPLRDAVPALANAGTGAALVLAGATAWGALARCGPTPRLERIQGAWLWVLTVLLVLLAGHRETTAAVEGLASPVRGAWHVVYFAVAGVLLGGVGRVLDVRAALLGGLALVLGAVVTAAFDFTAPPLGGWALVELLAPTGALLLVARLGRRDDPLVFPAALGGLLVAALTWGLYVLEQRLPAGQVLLNVRFLGGLLVLGAFFAL
ncbi:MAG: DUF2339 domain-containing protein, partial [Planctomycetota bacterium]